MILTRDDVKELTRTGSLEVVLTKVPATDKVQSVQISVGKPAVAEVRIIDTWPHRSGQTVAVVELVRQIKATPAGPRRGRDTVRLMKPKRGETTDSRSAMRVVHEQKDPDTTGVPYPNLVDSEPEIVDKETEDRFAQRSHRNHELRHLENQRRTLIERLDRTLEGCERLGIDPTRHIAAVDRRLTDLEKQVKKAERKAA